MHLYIFSFKHNWRYVVSFLCVCTVYMVCLLIIPKLDSGVSQFQTNVLKAQNYCFSDDEYSAVFVGSSELYNLPLHEVREDWCNLGFAGSSSLTGLSLLTQKDYNTRTVYVEVNDTCIREKSDDIIQSTQGLNCLFRESIRFDYLLYCLYHPIYNILKGDMRNNTTDTELVDLEVQNNQTLYDNDVVEERLGEVMKSVEQLKSNGIKVILVETPNDVALYDTPRFKQIRSVIDLKFPVEKYEWIRVDWDDYKTTDGVHLTRDSSVKFVEHLEHDYEMRIH